MATSNATSIGFSPFPQTPKPHSTPFCNTYNPPRHVERNVPSSRKGKLLGSIKALSLRRRQTVGSDTSNPRTLSKRKSAWELFSRRQRPSASGSSGDDHISQASHPRPVSALAGKTSEDKGKISYVIFSRQSLSDIFGRVTHKVSAKYTTLSRTTSHREFLSSLADPFLSSFNSETKVKPPVKDTHPINSHNHKTVLSLHLPGASLDGMSFTEPVECMADDPQAKQAEEPLELCNQNIQAPEKEGGDSPVMVTIREVGTTDSIDSTESKTESKSTSEENDRPRTPGLLCALIESNCGRSDTGCSNMELSPCPSPEKYQPMEAVDFLGEDCLDPTSRKASQLYTCGEGTIFEPSSFRDQRASIQVREVDPSFDTQDFDPAFYNKREEIKTPHTDTASTSSLEALIENDKAKQNLRLTLAKITKNLHVHSSEDTTLEQDDSETWKAIAVGNNILRKTKPYSRRKRISSCEERVETGSFANKVLEESIHFRTPPEPFRFNSFSPKRLTPRHVQIDLAETERKMLSKAASSPINKRRATSPEKASTYRPDIKPPMAENNLCTSMPTFIDFPKTRYSAEHVVECSSKAEAIAKLIHHSHRGAHAQFCTYDPICGLIKVFPNWAPIPSLKELKKSGHEIIWLPIERSLSSRNHSVVESSSSSMPLSDHPAWLSYHHEDDSNLEPLEVSPIEQLWTRAEDLGYSKELMRSDAKHPLNDDLLFLDQLAAEATNTECSEELNETMDFTKDLTKDLLSECFVRGKNKLETDFLAQSTAGSKPGCSSLNYNEPSNVVVEQDSLLQDELCPFETEVSSDFARSFLGSQFSDSPRESLSREETQRIFREIVGEEEREIFLKPHCNNGPESNKTWFDLAKEYKATHPSRDSSGHDMPGMIKTSESFKTWFDLEMGYKDPQTRRRVSTEYSGSCGSLSGSAVEDHASAKVLDEEKTLESKDDGIHVTDLPPQSQEAIEEVTSRKTGDTMLNSISDVSYEREKRQTGVRSDPHTAPSCAETKKDHTTLSQCLPPLFGEAERVLPLRLKGDQQKNVEIQQRLGSRIDEMIINLQAKEGTRTTSGFSYASGFKFSSFGDQLRRNTESGSSNTGDENAGQENARGNLRFGAFDPMRVRPKGPREIPLEELNSGTRTRQCSKSDQSKVSVLVDAFQNYSVQAACQKTSRPTSPTLARSQTVVRHKVSQSLTRHSSLSMNENENRPSSKPGKLSMRAVSSFLGSDSSVSSEADTEKSSAFGDHLKRYASIGRATDGTEVDERIMRDNALYG
ncbi:hypothetical protein HYALB_00005941 [Hymenoscyphus albidus]|uniref:Uncharacterized protein n=1 Tax=Hymenoscyphus albidus TaxID=595503 RepID=A0A9N9PQH2_9HELO|nr:hypothetical protein HYALB_00005941 [Hymenoscyphus albidus]